jgi:hypothetical protein
MSKLTKLMRNPGAFFRDFLIKRYPEDAKRYLESPVGLDAGSAGLESGIFVRHHELELFPVEFPVDAVITWVDDTDPAWREKKASALDNRKLEFHPESVVTSRFRNRGELKYLFRALTEFAPWFNHIYLVTDEQTPDWLARKHPRVTVVDHKEIIPSEYLPTFNSHVIEAHLHKIPGLSEHYVYFNDDVILARPCPAEHFFSPNENVNVFHTFKEIPPGPKTTRDTPVDIASKNARALIKERFDRNMRYKVAHTFHPQLRSVQEEMARIWGERFEQFFANQFRGENDVPVATYLFPYFAYLTGRAAIRQTSFAYFSIKSPAARRNYQLLGQRKGTEFAPFSMCLNDTDYERASSAVQEMREQEALDFLEEYFPYPSKFEVDEN